MLKLVFVAIVFGIDALVNAGFEGIHETCEPWPIPISKGKWMEKYGITEVISTQLMGRRFRSAHIYDNIKQYANSSIQTTARILMKQTGVIDSFRMTNNSLKFYNFIHGDAAVVHFINPATGEYTREELGFHTKKLFIVFPPGIWGAVEVVPHHFQDYIILTGVYTWMGPNKFQFANREKMLLDFPQHKDIIMKFTSDN